MNLRVLFVILLFYDVDFACEIQGTNNSYDWEGVNFVNCTKSIEVLQANNVVLNECGFIVSGGVILNGSVLALVIKTTIFFGNTTPNEKLVNITNNAIILNRISIEQAPILCGEATQTAVFVDAAASFPSILSASNYPFDLTKVRFSNEGTPLVGRIAGDGFTRVENCPPLLDSKVNAEITMFNNATPTPIAVLGDYYSIEGTFIESSTTQEFLITGSVAIFNGRSEKNIAIEVIASATASNNNVLGTAIRYTPFGGTSQLINPTKSTANGAGRAENLGTLTNLNLKNGDSIEPVVTNFDTNTVTVEGCITIFN